MGERKGEEGRERKGVTGIGKEEGRGREGEGEGRKER